MTENLFYDLSQKLFNLAIEQPRKVFIGFLSILLRIDFVKKYNFYDKKLSYSLGYNNITPSTFCLILEKVISDGQVDRTSASDSVDLGKIFQSGQAKDFRKLAFTAFLLGVQL